MLPSQPNLTGKRKADDSNPLLNAAAAKRAKKEVFYTCMNAGIPLDLTYTYQMSSLTGKRKVDYSNPLLNDAAAKRAKQEVCFSKIRV
jgi:hypothetical protein